MSFSGGLPWLAVGEPIQLAGNVSKDLCEAQAFEARRGPEALERRWHIFSPSLERFAYQCIG
jgi:hypothetical protein